MAERIIGKKELRELTKISADTWARMERACKAPARIRLSPGRVGWRLSEVQSWLEGLTAALSSGKRRDAEIVDE